MASEIFQENRVMQVCFLTDSLEKTVDYLTDLFDRAPNRFTTSSPPGESMAEYRGEPTDTTCRQAVWEFDNLSIEVIAPNDQPSTWRDYLQEHGPGIHHIAFRVTGMQEKVERLAAKGIPIVQRGEFRRGRYAYADTQAALGAVVEMLEFDR